MLKSLLWENAGVSSGLNLMSCLVEKDLLTTQGVNDELVG